MSKNMSQCRWRYDFTDMHRGEYWYVCETCGIKEWFARYDRPQDGKPGIKCPKKGE